MLFVWLACVVYWLCACYLVWFKLVFCTVVIAVCLCDLCFELCLCCLGWLTVCIVFGDCWIAYLGASITCFCVCCLICLDLLVCVGCVLNLCLGLRLRN